jgi:hypothetical protein
MTPSTTTDGTLLFSLVLDAKVRRYNADAQRAETSPPEEACDTDADPANDVVARTLLAIRNPYSLVRSA